MSSPNLPICRVALDTPLNHGFDYALPSELATRGNLIGCRAAVPFRRGQKIGIVTQQLGQSEVPSSKLKAIHELIDQAPILSGGHLQLLQWAASYYHHPLGEVIAAALPKWVRTGRTLTDELPGWALAYALGADHIERVAKKAKLQGKILQTLAAAPDGLAEAELKHLGTSWRQAIKKLVEHQLIKPITLTLQNITAKQPITVIKNAGPTLNPEQRVAVDAIDQASATACSFLLNGITGSGKTEVYLRCFEKQLNQGQQVLALVPEIGLTPQTVKRFRERFNVPVLAYHSGLTDRERFDTWRAASSEAPCVVIGTRSAIFLPLPNLGLIVVDEEHDPSFKQQEGFRYSARDLAIVRAHTNKIPVILGSATPSLESIRNVQRDDNSSYRLLNLTQRIGSAKPPAIHCIDLRHEAIEEGLSHTLRKHIADHLAQGAQVLLFLNRRGYAPAWVCQQCGWAGTCNHCDARLVYHHQKNQLRCHHCNSSYPLPSACPDCAEELKPMGQGTERIELALQTAFADTPIYRVDADTMQSKRQFEQTFEQVHTGEPCILIGTQMLSKGHHFANVSLVGILNADYGLFGTDFRSMERLAQIIVQVSGRAGREQRPGQVLIQTHHPHHPMLQQLIQQGYWDFAATALSERATADWPPYSHLALLRATGLEINQATQFLQAAAKRFPRSQEVRLLGPAPAPMLKRGGRYHAQLLVKSAQRKALHDALNGWLPVVRQIKAPKQLRWSIDIDPIELF